MTNTAAPSRPRPSSSRFALAGPSWKRIWAIFIARNREFYRDTAGLIWNILMPVLMIVAFAFIFGSGSQTLLKIGVIGFDPGSGAPVASDQSASAAASPERGLDGLFAIDAVQLVPIGDADAGIAKVARHQLDLLLRLGESPAYWVNPESTTGDVAERLLVGAVASAGMNTVNAGAPPSPERLTAPGAALSYADWAVPGVLAMNLMFSSLWGVGWVVVRYRKNGVLRRLKATPLTPIEFLMAQILSRLLVVLSSSLIVYAGALVLLDFPMQGSYVALALIYVAGALCMISLGLIVSSRLRTEELADGLLNLMSWPMLLLSGVWFSMEGTSAAAQVMSRLMPLTYLVEGARAVMIDGAGLLDILPQLGLLVATALLLIGIAARLFRWE